MNKTLSKATMVLNLETNSSKIRMMNKKKNYVQQRNLSLKKRKENILATKMRENICDNKTFSKVIKPKSSKKN